jgi:hypothetical protein
MGSPVIDCLALIFELVFRSLVVLFTALGRLLEFLFFRVIDLICLALTIASLGSPRQEEETTKKRKKKNESEFYFMFFFSSFSCFDTPSSSQAW